MAVMHSISKMERRREEGGREGEGGGGWEAECHFQVSPRHFPLMRDGFCSADSRGDRGSPPPHTPRRPPLRSDLQSSEELTAPRSSPPPAQPHFRRHNNNRRSRGRICHGGRTPSRPRQGAHHSQSGHRAPPSHPRRISRRLPSLSLPSLSLALSSLLPPKVRDGEEGNSQL